MGSDSLASCATFFSPRWTLVSSVTPPQCSRYTRTSCAHKNLNGPLKNLHGKLEAPLYSSWSIARSFLFECKRENGWEGGKKTMRKKWSRPGCLGTYIAASIRCTTGSRSTGPPKILEFCYCNPDGQTFFNPPYVRIAYYLPVFRLRGLLEHVCTFSSFDAYLCLLMLTISIISQWNSTSPNYFQRVFNKHRHFSLPNFVYLRKSLKFKYCCVIYFVSRDVFIYFIFSVSTIAFVIATNQSLHNLNSSGIETRIEPNELIE